MPYIELPRRRRPRLHPLDLFDLWFLVILPGILWFSLSWPWALLTVYVYTGGRLVGIAEERMAQRARRGPSERL